LLQHQNEKVDAKVTTRNIVITTSINRSSTLPIMTRKGGNPHEQQQDESLAKGIQKPIEVISHKGYRPNNK
jgi:hypothetical protein